MITLGVTHERLSTRFEGCFRPRFALAIVFLNPRAARARSRCDEPAVLPHSPESRANCTADHLKLELTVRS
jgi:hypothetical protein